MNRKQIPVWIGLLIGACLGLAGATGEAASLLLFTRPWAMLGNLLRRWSESGAAGNAGAWAVLALFAAAPVCWILHARRKRRHPGDVLFILAGAAGGIGLYLAVNPFLLYPAALPEEMENLLSAAPMLAFGSLLAAAVIVRWVSGLDGNKLTGSLAALTGCGMGLIALSVGRELTASVAALFAAPETGLLEEEISALAGAFPGEAASSLPAKLAAWLLSVVALVPEVFLLYVLDGAHGLVCALNGGFFTEQARDASALMALRARRSLIASACSMAAGNVLQMLWFRGTGSVDVTLALPLSEMAFSCAALLLAGILSSACRIQRDNELMI